MKFSRHVNFAILRKICIFSHFNLAFFSETIHFFGNLMSNSQIVRIGFKNYYLAVQVDIQIVKVNITIHFL